VKKKPIAIMTCDREGGSEDKSSIEYGLNKKKHTGFDAIMYRFDLAMLTDHQNIFKVVINHDELILIEA
jgi:hypothetical protein